MNKALFPHLIFCASFIVFAGFTFSFGQLIQKEDTLSPALAEDAGQFRIVNFRERELGWVSGRIFDLTNDEASPRPVSDVKVILRSSKAGFESFIREQVSSEEGVYDFHNLGSGEYTVEIDKSSLPAKYRLNSESPIQVTVRTLSRSYVNLPVLLQRIITGVVYIDKDGDGRFDEGKDEKVGGASITSNGSYAISDANGSYVLRDLPAGRIGLLVSQPHRVDTTHVVLDLGSGSVTNRVVNVPLNR